MASKEQSRAHRRDSDPDDGAAADAPEVAARKEGLDDDIDSVLDEIDGVLESNAEEFVRSFVQKGGE